MGHRRWLPRGHNFHRQRKAFNGYSEDEPAPQPLSSKRV